MTTKERINFLVGEVGRFTASHFNLVDPDDVKKEHTDFAYGILWANDKLGVEMSTDRFKVKRSIQDAVEEWNINFVEEVAA